MEPNKRLAQVLSESGLTQEELAEAVNDYLRSLGREGTVSTRTVRFWLTGKTRWPHPRQREALSAVFGCPAEELGFKPPAGRCNATSDREDPVRRRNFITATAGATAGATPLVADRRNSVGTTDVLRLRSGLDTLTALDASRGGHEALEQSALAGAAEALEKQQSAASQRIRQRLFSIAANYTSLAAWSAVDARQLERAQGHLHRALYLAGMAKDPVAELRVWNSHAMLAREQRDRHTEVVDAGQAAQGTSAARNDPLFASLAHARTALGHAGGGDRQAALRSLGYAREAMSRADLKKPRPAWVSFYDPAELEALTGIVHQRIGEPARAEAAAHRALMETPERFRRNRAMTVVSLAIAQLHQQDVDQACATAGKTFALMGGDPIPGRMRSLLGDFHRDLITYAPDSSVTREWTERYRSEWSRTP